MMLLHLVFIFPLYTIVWVHSIQWGFVIVYEDGLWYDISGVLKLNANKVTLVLLVSFNVKFFRLYLVFKKMAPEAGTPDLARLQAELPSIEPGEGRTASEQVIFILNWTAINFFNQLWFFVRFCSIPVIVYHYILFTGFQIIWGVIVCIMIISGFFVSLI